MEENDDEKLGDGRPSLNPDLGQSNLFGNKREIEQKALKRDEKLLDQEITDKILLTWEDFNCNFDSVCPPFSEIKEITDIFADKKVDLRPYMVPKPYRVLETDTIDHIHALFRHMDLRTLPVLKEEDNTLVGVITRQDLF